MDNTEKLLRALIKAQGYEICEGKHLFINGIRKDDLHSIVPAREGDDVRYESYYKVTKKPISNQLPESAKSISFGPSVLNG